MSVAQFEKSRNKEKRKEGEKDMGIEDLIHFLASMNFSTTLYGVRVVIIICIILIAAVVAAIWKPLWTGESN